MTVDLDDIERRIADGIYGDDRMTKEERNDAFSALAEIIAEVERLRACLKWYVDHDDTNEWEESNAFWLEGRRKATEVLERGEHRREEDKRLTDAVAEDRAALVAWLRDGGAPLTRSDYEMILRGEHRREEES